MARANFVKKSRKAYPDAGIGKGESYWWYQFAYGSKIRTKNRPRPSQLTRSEHYSTVYGWQEQVEDAGTDEAEGVNDILSAIKDEVEGWKDDIEDRKSNVEEAFPNGSPVIDTLEARVDAMETLEQEIDSAMGQLQEIDGDTDSQRDDIKTELALQREVKDEEIKDDDEELESRLAEWVAEQVDTALSEIAWDVGE